LAAIAVGVGSMILSGGFFDDVYVRFAEAIIHSQTGHIQFAPKGFFAAGSRSPEKYLISDPEQEKSLIASVPGVTDTMARLFFSGLLNNGKADLPIVGEGLEPDKEASLGSYIVIKEGRGLSDLDRYGIVVGAGLARALAIHPGDSVVLLASTSGGAVNTLDLEVVGIFQTYSQDYDARAVKIPLASAQELLNTTGANLVVVALEQTSKTDQVASVLRERTLWRNQEVRTWLELSHFYRSTVQLYQRQFGVLSVVILAMVFLGVMNTINMTVLERTGEFGTMRALGNRGTQIFGLVVAEGIILGLIGAAVGATLGILLAIGISAVGIPMPPGPNSDLGYTAYIRVVPSVVAWAALVGLTAATLASLLPALRVSRIHIADALRQNV
jgi:putative ABC transport system permease protein